MSEMTDTPQTAVEMGICPVCGRKLLTMTSALCNWCGAKIDDPEYQERAAQTRLERDQTERAGLEAIVQEDARYGVWGRLKRRAKEKGSGSKDL